MATNIRLANAVLLWILSAHYAGHAVLPGHRFGVGCAT